MKLRAGTGPIRLQTSLQSCAMDMICGKLVSEINMGKWLKVNRFAFSETTLGYNIQSQAEEDSEFLHKTHVILDVTARRFFQPWIQPAFLFRLSKHSKPFYRSVKYLNKFLSDVRLTHFHF